MHNVWKVLNIFEQFVMVLGMGIMVLFNFLNIVFRYLLPQTPFSYTEEFIVLVFVWTSMFGISYGYRRSAHTMLTIFTDKVQGKWQYLVIIFATLASALLMIMLARTGYAMVQNQIEFQQILPGMQIPAAIMGVAIPFGAAVSCISILHSGLLEILTLHGMLQNHTRKMKTEEGVA